MQVLEELHTQSAEIELNGCCSPNQMYFGFKQPIEDVLATSGTR